MLPLDLLVSHGLPESRDCRGPYCRLAFGRFFPRPPGRPCGNSIRRGDVSWSAAPLSTLSIHELRSDAALHRLHSVAGRRHRRPVLGDRPAAEVRPRFAAALPRRTFHNCWNWKILNGSSACRL